MLRRMISKVLDWIGRARVAITPHPDMSTDRGERRHIEGLMEHNAMHVGRMPRTWL